MTSREKLQAALDALQAATAAYEVAADKETATRMAATTALNNLNRAQRHFDAVTEEIRGLAPGRTDWRKG